MAVTVTRFVLLLLLSLLVGTMFGIWVGYDPASLSAASYVEQQQNAIRAFNTLLPAIGAVCIVLTTGLAINARSDALVRYAHVVAAVCMVVAALVTRFGNQPINAVVMTWVAQAPAANWTELRDTWWQWHVVRTTAGICALALTLVAVLAPARGRSGSPTPAGTSSSPTPTSLPGSSSLLPPTPLGAGSSRSGLRRSSIGRDGTRPR